MTLRKKTGMNSLTGIVLALTALFVMAILPLQQSWAIGATHVASDASEHDGHSGSPDSIDHSHCSLDLRCLSEAVFTGGGPSKVPVDFQKERAFGSAMLLRLPEPSIELPPPRA